MNRFLLFFLIAPLVWVVGCGSGSNPPRCSLNNGTTLSVSPWPRFRANMANSGLTPADVSGNPGTARWTFSLTTPVSIESSPIVGGGQVVFGSSDGQVHVLDSATGLPNTSFTDTLNNDIGLRGAITAAALLGEDGHVFVATGDGRVIQVDQEGALVHTTSVGGFVNASPNIGADGEIYVSSTAGSFVAVCPNGVPRFSLVIAPSRSSAAVASDNFCAAFFQTANSKTCPRIYVGANDAQLSAYDILGRQEWAFFASAPIVASVVLDEVLQLLPPQAVLNRAYVVDSAGRLFAVGLTDGAKLSPRPFTAPGPVTASPAFVPGIISGRPSTLYVADQTGVLTAVEINTAINGTVTFNPRVVFEAGVPINSSPAVAIGGGTPILVFGADNGSVYAVADAQAQCADDVCDVGPNAGAPCTTANDCALLWAFDAGSPIGNSSPAIDADGTVYIGSQGGMLFAIGGPAATPTPTPSPTPTHTPES